MAFKGIEYKQFLKFIFGGLVVLFGLIKIIVPAELAKGNFVLQPDLSASTPYQILGFTIVCFVVFFVWVIFEQTEGRWDKKKLVSFGLTALALYALYVYILQPFMPALFPSLKLAVYTLHKNSQVIQSIIGMP